jgi:hypothetical protein
MPGKNFQWTITDELLPMDLLQALTPRLPRRYLLLIAAVVWTFAGSLLLFRGILMFLENGRYLWVRLIISAIGGMLFYKLLFSGISRKHARRIMDIPRERPCLFSFFNIKSYILMSIMITAGIMLRKSGMMPHEYLSMVYVTMGIPLLASSFRFYHTGFNNL